MIVTHWQKHPFEFENIDIDWKVNVLINLKILFDVDNIDCLSGKLRCDLYHDTSAFCKTLTKDDRISIHRPSLTMVDLIFIGNDKTSLVAQFVLCTIQCV